MSFAPLWCASLIHGRGRRATLLSARVSLRHRAFVRAAWPIRHATAAHNATLKEDGGLHRRRCEMPKLKTKSGAKKRFKLTASGLIKAGVAGKRHRLMSHNAKYIRQNRGTKVMSASDAKIIKTYLPNGLP
jgi:large subunit ribosomal protein L35